MNKDTIFAAALAVAMGLSGWVWSLYAGLQERSDQLIRDTAVLSVGKADRQEISEIKVQLVRQTTLMERQMELGEQHARILEELIRRGE